MKKLYQDDLVSLEDAMGAADNPEELKLELKGVTKGTRSSNFDFDY